MTSASTRWRDWLRGAFGLVIVLLTIAVINQAIAQVQGGSLADEETPAGVVDGMNSTFMLVHQPFPWISLKLYLNGIRLFRCRNGNTQCDYTLIPPYNTVQFMTPPQPGDVILADYRY